MGLLAGYREAVRSEWSGMTGLKRRDGWMGFGTAQFGWFANPFIRRTTIRLLQDRRVGMTARALSLLFALNSFT